MKRRDLIATAITAPHLLLTGCASPASPGANGGTDPSKAQITVLYDAFGHDPALQKDWGYAAFVEELPCLNGADEFSAFQSFGDALEIRNQRMLRGIFGTLLRRRLGDSAVNFNFVRR